jgi:dTDP-4-dehydrorhamnose 3,5-epimerase-like enzyme
MTTVEDCKLVGLSRIEEPTGALTPVNAGDEVPFDVKRVFYVYDVVGGAVRGGHAHLELEQFMVTIIGSVTVVLDDGEATREVHLRRPYEGLYVPQHIWVDLRDFSGGAVAVVLASLPYDESEYIRDHDAFLRHRRTLGAR